MLPKISKTKFHKGVVMHFMSLLGSLCLKFYLNSITKSLIPLVLSTTLKQTIFFYRISNDIFITIKETQMIQ